jgi:transcriptional regulator with XRE-family HTH domain
MNDVPSRLKDARKHLGYTQKDMAAAVGSAFPSWQDYEAGKKSPGSKVIAGLARLGVNANWVLIGEGPMMLSGSADAKLSPPSLGVAEAPHAYTVPGQAQVSIRLLTDIIEAIEAVLQERRLQLPPGAKAEAVSLVYEMEAARAGEERAPRATVLRLLKFREATG